MSSLFPPPFCPLFDALPAAPWPFFAAPLAPVLGLLTPPGFERLSGTTLPESFRRLVTPAVGELFVAADAGPGVGVAFLPWLAAMFLFAAGLLDGCDLFPPLLFAVFEVFAAPLGLLSCEIPFFPALFDGDL